MFQNKKWMHAAVLLFIGFPVLASEGHGPNWIELIARLLNVVVFAGILAYFLKKPLADFFSARVARIKADLELAKTSREEAEKRLAEIEEQMAGLETELETIAQKAREDAEHEAERMKQRVNEETAKIQRQAEMDIEQARLDGLNEVKRHIVDLAVQKVEETLADRVAQDDQDRLIQDFAEKMGA